MVEDNRGREIPIVIVSNDGGIEDHKCCENASLMLYPPDKQDDTWTIMGLDYGDCFPVVFCPWCGERLPLDEK